VAYSLSVLCKLHNTNATKIKNEADWTSRALAASIGRLVGYSLIFPSKCSGCSRANISKANGLLIDHATNPDQFGTEC